ncbi:putative ribosomal N-acetyltransferase YdaF [Desulfosporosinus acididurans]|uniref:Putative ribosomal N-acetyltransferase YdaF n=1 Tax=Desulfosporosinus acididurans TaxID=476652 RepID=A0A0J1FKS3_9FIRM|nr:putative ribosomal N-acetyltransferase YdaF [Desulfosporosinus acididurans]
MIIITEWAILLKETDECIGQIAYFLVDNNNHLAEIEYRIGRNFQRKGLATEATKAVIQFGFSKMNLHKVQICHKSTNIPSRKVIEKCGFIYEGTLRDFFYMDSQYVDRLYYSILIDEFKSR